MGDKSNKITMTRGRWTVLAVVVILCALAGFSVYHFAHAQAMSAGTSFVAHHDDGILPASTDSDSLLVMETDGSVSSIDSPLKVSAASDEDDKAITLVTEFFPTSRMLFIYVDGELVDTQDEPHDRTVVHLSGNQLSSGEHKVEAVQYAGDSTVSTVTTYKTSSYVVSR